MRTGSAEVRGYNAGAMLLHWAIALAILFQLAGGFAMMRLDVLPDAGRFAFFQWHKTVGLLVLTLTLARIAWRLLNPPPAHAPMSRVEAGAAHLVHGLFYALMLLVPLSGWFVVSASPTAIPTLLFLSEHLPWPNLPIPAAWRSEGGESVAATLHMVLAYSTLALLVLHVAGALKHSVLDRQASFRRMMPVGHLPRQSTALLAIPLAVGLATLFLGGGLAAGQGEGAEAPALAAREAPAAQPAEAGGWVVDKAASRFTYEASFSGKPMTGDIAGWTAAIRFDPADLAQASARIEIDAASITVGDPFVRSSAPGPDGLDIAAHPSLAVALDRFEKSETGFRAQGTVTIKGQSAPIEVPFTFEPQADGSAHVAGSGVIDRLAFGLGTKNDPAAQWLGREITVRFDLRAAPAPALGT
ncbi:cytochrome b/b6 domain-containing protein [Aureimonas sp. AU20]|uniref:cytochrome b/b6 domain-containing protein n=1 Tax=Aureimonas sp. AU20 TaxID=1349819 RepID=UPI000722C782|nr:cytochrome b/b6 domain-containing protein [Aureimonas sp. AU20]ALN74275.1 hypothetical protein M673_16230 [Aureimonas sp. AU20]